MRRLPTISHNAHLLPPKHRNGGSPYLMNDYKMNDHNF
jgi:hypothetical protein